MAMLGHVLGGNLLGHTAPFCLVLLCEFIETPVLRLSTHRG